MCHLCLESMIISDSFKKNSRLLKQFLLTYHLKRRVGIKSNWLQLEDENYNFLNN